MRLQQLLPLWVLSALSITACSNGSATPRDSGTVPGGRDSGGGGPSADGSSGQPPAGDAGGRGQDGGRTGDGGGDGDGDGTTCDASRAPDVGSLALTPVVSGLNRLVFAAQPKGSNDWYLVEQTGRIRVYTNGSLRPTSFLDLSSEIGLGTQNDERGLLGLAFPDDYATSGRFYVTITPTSGDNANRDLVLEYRRSSADPLVADPDTRKTILRLDSSASNHNGGHIAFGPDGMLYVGTGDGGGGCNDNKPGMPQDVGSLFGKILRLDPTGTEPYAAPGNPFADTGDARVLHYGLRNPFRFGFDRATGDLYIGDVGQDTYEEIHVASAAQKGLNFGWAAYEGTRSTCTGKSLRPGSTHTPPIVEAHRARFTCSGPYCDYQSIIGGVVYRGSAVPKLKGAYLFGDYFGRRMGALYHCGTSTSEVTLINKRCDPNAPTEACFVGMNGAPQLNELTAIVEDNAGELYLVANRETLLKIVAGP